MSNRAKIFVGCIVGLSVASIAGCGRSGTPQSTDQQQKTAALASAASAQLAADPLGRLDADGTEPVTFAISTGEHMSGAQTKSSKCNVDSIFMDGRTNNGEALAKDARPIISGWVTNPTATDVPPSFHLLLRGAKDYDTLVHTGTLMRPDVAKAMNLQKLTSAGFQIKANLSGMAPGKYSFAITGVDDAGPWYCAPNRNINVL